MWEEDPRIYRINPVDARVFYFFKYMDTNKYHKTNSFYCAAFLFAKGLELVNVDRTDPRKCIFVFANHPDLELLLRVFNFAGNDDPAVMIDARKLIYAVKKLKDSLYEKNY